MKEKLIDFETAKLASEVYFDIPTKYIYCSEYKNRYLNTYTCSEQMYWCPTQSLLQKWLREEHKIHIKIEAAAPYGVYHGVLQLLDLPKNKTMPAKLGYENIINVQKAESYEKALEMALQEALNLI